MKVFRPKSKPKRWEIVFSLTLIFIGFVCRRILLPEDNTLLRSAILFGRATLPVGIGYMIGLAIRLSRYYRLSPEDRRDEDRQDRDERNLMIRDRAAWIAHNVVACTLTVTGALFSILGHWDIAFLCLGTSIFALIVWSVAVVWIRRKPL